VVEMKGRKNWSACCARVWRWMAVREKISYEERNPSDKLRVAKYVRQEAGK